MQPHQLLDDAFARIPDLVHRAIDGLGQAGLRWRPDPDANPVGWLVWHLTRVQDDHVAELMDAEQVWVTDGWAPHFGLPIGTRETGFGHAFDEVAAVQPEDVASLDAYLSSVTDRTRSWLAGLGAHDLDRVVDTSWDPPVTMGVRLISVLGDSLQHAGQAAYVRGLYERMVRPER